MTAQHTPLWLEARRRLRGYVRHGLYADLPLGEQHPSLCLPRLAPVQLEDADIYEARRGSGDPPVDEDGNVRVRSLVRGASDDPTSTHALSLAGWRIYAGRELDQAEPPDLVVEHATVLAAVSRLEAQHWRALWDWGHEKSVKAVMHERSLSSSAVRWQTSTAIDELLARLYETSGQLAAPNGKS